MTRAKDGDLEGRCILAYKIRRRVRDQAVRSRNLVRFKRVVHKTKYKKDIRGSQLDDLQRRDERRLQQLRKHLDRCRSAR